MGVMGSGGRGRGNGGRGRGSEILRGSEGEGGVVEGEGGVVEGRRRFHRRSRMPIFNLSQ